MKRLLRGGRLTACGVLLHPVEFAKDEGTGLRAGLLLSRDPIGAAKTGVLPWAPTRAISHYFTLRDLITHLKLVDLLKTRAGRPGFYRAG